MSLRQQIPQCPLRDPASSSSVVEYSTLISLGSLSEKPIRVILANSKVLDMRESGKYTGLARQTGRHIENRLLERLFNADPSTTELK